MFKDYIKRLNGMQKFNVIWFGQFISIMGTTMTRFAMLIWAYEQMGKASTTALLGFFSIFPYIILSPLAGVIVDRISRKKILILSDLAAGIVTASILVLFISGKIQVWHLFVAEAFSSAFEAFQIPAYSAAVTMLISKDKYDKASGMRSLSNDFSKIAAPIIVGIIMNFIGIKGVMLIDLVTFLISMFTLSLINIPDPEFTSKKKDKKESIYNELRFSIKYLLDRRGLLYLVFIMLVMNFVAAATYFGILPAMILARSGSNKMILATIQSALGIGGVAGGLIVSIWGCPRKKVLTIIFAAFGSFILGDILLAAGTTVYIWSIGAFLSSVFIPFIYAAQQSIWQSKVEPSIQGRIFSIKNMIQLSVMPIGYILGGILADYVFEPIMASNGILPMVFGSIVGTGKGSGMAVMFLFSGILGSLICLSGLFVKDIINLETNLPDHDEKIKNQKSN